MISVLILNIHRPDPLGTSSIALIATYHGPSQERLLPRRNLYCLPRSSRRLDACRAVFGIQGGRRCKHRISLCVCPPSDIVSGSNRAYHDHAALPPPPTRRAETGGVLHLRNRSDARDRIRQETPRTVPVRKRSTYPYHSASTR